MNKYYEKFIKDNEEIFLLVANKVSTTGSMRQMLNGTPINQRLNLDIDRKYHSIIEVNPNRILLTLSLRNTYTTISWQLDKDNMTYQEKMNFNAVDFFKRPIEINLSSQERETKTIQLSEGIIFERIAVSKLKLESNSTTLSIKYSSKTEGKRYEGTHQFILDSNLNTEHVTKGSNKDPNVENEFLILTKLKDIKENFNYIEDITDYLFLGKKIPSEIEDILPLSIDMDKDYLNLHKDYTINIDDLRNEYLKIKEKKDLKIKNRMK